MTTPKKPMSREEAAAEYASKTRWRQVGGGPIEKIGEVVDEEMRDAHLAGWDRHAEQMRERVEKLERVAEEARLYLGAESLGAQALYRTCIQDSIAALDEPTPKEGDVTPAKGGSEDRQLKGGSV
jgi:hypothetical protein